MFLVTYHHPVNGVHQSIMFVSHTKDEALTHLTPWLSGKKPVERQHNELWILEINQYSGERYVIRPVEVR